jgi:hypothetical protein
MNFEMAQKSVLVGLVLIVALLIPAKAELDLSKSRREFDSNAPIGKYYKGLVDLDSETVKPTGYYAECWWGIPMSSSVTWNYSFSFNYLTQGRQDLFISRSRHQLLPESIPTSAIWNPMNAEGLGAGTVTTNPNPMVVGTAPAKILYRKLHLMNHLWRFVSPPSSEKLITPNGTAFGEQPLADNLVVVIAGWNRSEG